MASPVYCPALAAIEFALPAARKKCHARLDHFAGYPQPAKFYGRDLHFPIRVTAAG